MDLAVRTTASPTAIWVMVIMLSILTGILVSAAAMADAWQVRANRRARRLAALGFREISSADAAGAGRETVPVPRPGEPAADAPTRSDLPAVPGGRAMPGQRGGESDRAERAGAEQRAGDGVPEGDDPGQRRH